MHMHMHMRLNLQQTHLGFAGVLDFGTAKMIDAQQMASTHCGTPLYLAPEVHQRGKKYGAPCDMVGPMSQLWVPCQSWVPCPMVGPMSHDG